MAESKIEAIISMNKGFQKIDEQLSVSLGGKVGVAKFRAEIPAQAVTDDVKRVLGEATLWSSRHQRASVTDNVDVPDGRPMLTDDRYVYADFRALSQVLLRNRGLDFSTDGVLKKAVPMLLGKTVYPNHEFDDVNNWVGVVSQSTWDAKGEKSNGVPGVNVEIKVDAFLNYRLACGLMMTPPAVNSMSLTVVFEFEYSHPQMAIENSWKFYENLGEEIDGEVVRLIVTKVVEVWEASIVSVGEDRLAKNITTESDAQTKSFSAETAGTGATSAPPNSKDEEKRTMRLTNEQKAKLGIEFDGDDVPETDIFNAADSLADRLAAVDTVNLEQLNARAAAGDMVIAEKRADVMRLARLAELGAEDGELNAVLVEQINEASVERLQQLGDYYGNKAADRFPAGGRSSLEDNEAVDNAGGVSAAEAELPEVGLL